MEKVIKIAVEGAAYLPIDSLEPFQGSLKRLERAEYEQLRKNLIENGFSFTVHVWQNEGKNYIIDGHQRTFALKQMRDVEGYTIPDLPVSFVHADTFAEAKRRILAGTSQYGRMTQDSLATFLRESDIPFDDVVATFHFPEINMEKFSAMFAGIVADEQLPDMPPPETPEMRSASDGVRQVQLYFSTEAHAEFMFKLEDLAKHRGLENISDAVLEVVREAHSATVQA